MELPKAGVCNKSDVFLHGPETMRDDVESRKTL